MWVFKIHTWSRLTIKFVTLILGYMSKCLTIENLHMFITDSSLFTPKPPCNAHVEKRFMRSTHMLERDLWDQPSYALTASSQEVHSNFTCQICMLFQILQSILSTSLFYCSVFRIYDILEHKPGEVLNARHTWWAPHPIVNWFTT